MTSVSCWATVASRIRHASWRTVTISSRKEIVCPLRSQSKTMGTDHGFIPFQFALHLG
jgi:hypothetical protein